MGEGFSKKDFIRDTLDDTFAEARSSAPAPPPRRLAPRRPEAVPVPALDVVTVLSAPAPDGVAPSAPLTPVAAATAPTPTTGPDDDLPGYATGNGRRVVAAFLPPEVHTLLERATPKGGTRGAAVVHALRIAKDHLITRVRAEEAPEDLWDDPVAQPYRRHTARPVRITFTVSRNQAIALRDLAKNCQESNMSRLISDAITYAYTPAEASEPVTNGRRAAAR